MSQYWKIREKSEKAIVDRMKADRVFNKAVKDMYYRLLDDIQGDIDSFFQRYAGKENFSLSEAKKRVSKHDVEKFADKAKRYVKERNFTKKANEELRLYNVTMRANRLELLKKNIQLEVIALSSDEERLLKEHLTSEIIEEVERQSGILGWTVLNAEQVRRTVDIIVNSAYQGAVWSERIWINGNNLQRDIERVVESTLVRGENPRVSARKLRQHVSESIGKAKFYSERLAINEVARAQIQTQERAYKANGIAEYEYIAEPTACKICSQMDEKVFKVEKLSIGENAPLMHVNCRCSTAPYISREAWERKANKR